MALASLCQEARSGNSEVEGPINHPDGCPRTNAEFTAFIVDHRMRHESELEAERVAIEIEKLGIEHQVLQLDWQAYGDPSSLANVESIARKLRYQALGRACRARGITTLLVGHHADDQAETVMSRIVSQYYGSGLAGIASSAEIPECFGIYGVHQSGRYERSETFLSEADAKSQGTILIEKHGVRIARPLLSFRKKTLISTCQEAGIRWFEDRTNADRTLTIRNTIRDMLKRDVLPRALQTEKLLSIADNAIRKKRDTQQAVHEIFESMSIALNLRLGAATFVVRPLSEIDPPAGNRLATSLLRRMLELVSPKSIISLQSLDKARDFVFGSDASRVPEFSCQVTGVSIELKSATEHSNPGSSTFTFRRSVPTRMEAQSTQTLLWSPAGSAAQVADASCSEWRLWDNRYWIKVIGPTTSADADSEIIARFLTRDDMAVLRRSLNKLELERLNIVLADAKGDLRFTLPALVEKRTLDQQNPATVSERIVALPSLKWSADGWRRATDTSPADCWVWDVRYRSVELDSPENHRVIS